jgi:hypothetical protein
MTTFDLFREKCIFQGTDGVGEGGGGFENLIIFRSSQ